MNTATILRKAKKAWAKDNECSVRDLANDLGYRVRQTKETRAMNDDVVEVGSGYFYESQQHVQGVADDFVLYAGSVGIVVSLTPVNDRIRFNSKPWPKDSWATRCYTLKFKHIDQQSA